MLTNDGGKCAFTHGSSIVDTRCRKSNFKTVKLHPKKYFDYLTVCVVQLITPLCK